MARTTTDRGCGASPAAAAKLYAASGMLFYASAAAVALLTQVEGVPNAQPEAPIIGGSGEFRYQYMPDLLKLPAGA